MTKQNKKLLALAAAALALAAVLVCAWLLAAPQGAAGSKALTLTVAYADGSTDEFCFTTDAEFLRGALEEQQLVAGDESEYGLFIKTVNGVTADEGQQQWWCLTRGGAEVMTGVDSTPIADGDQFELTLKTGW